MSPSLPLAANCSLLFTEHPLLHRFDAAKAAGFDAVELWWPWPTPLPDHREVDALITAVRNSGVQLIGLNFFAGDLAGSDCGAASVPALSDAFRDNIAVVADIGRRLGVTAFNALYGNRIDGIDPQRQDELALENLTTAAAAVRDLPATVLIEPVSGPKPYPLRTAQQAADIVERLHEAGSRNAAILFDVFHLVSNGDDIDAALSTYGDLVGHVQVADAPGRGEPGTGTIDFTRVVGRLKGCGYRGHVALEYRPSTGDTAVSLAWLRDPANPTGLAPTSNDDKDSK